MGRGGGLPFSATLRSGSYHPRTTLGRATASLKGFASPVLAMLAATRLRVALGGPLTLSLPLRGPSPTWRLLPELEGCQWQTDGVVRAQAKGRATVRLFVVDRPEATQSSLPRSRT